MKVYFDALNWANERGDSGGAMRMRQALLSLYNWWWEFPIGEALSNLDGRGKGLLLACLNEYARVGETEELRQVGAAIIASGYVEGWRELLEAAHSTKDAVRRNRESDGVRTIAR